MIGLRVFDVPVGTTPSGVVTVRVEAVWPPASQVEGAETKEVEHA